MGRDAPTCLLRLAGRHRLLSLRKRLTRRRLADIDKAALQGEEESGSMETTVWLCPRPPKVHATSGRGAACRIGGGAGGGEGRDLCQGRQFQRGVTLPPGSPAALRF